MLPPFDEHGYLLPGVHRATLDEIDLRFGQTTELRQVQMESVRWMVDPARRSGIERFVINGSFATDTSEPNDVECVLLMGDRFPHDEQAARELEDGLLFLEINFVRQARFDILIERFFATDRRRVPKGMVEVIL